MLPHFELVRKSDCTCPCRKDNWNFECCPLKAVFDIMPGPSTDKTMANKLRLMRSCSVALQRLEDLPRVHVQNHVARKMKRNSDSS